MPRKRKQASKLVEQTEMAFMDTPQQEEVDPISGNDVPPGSEPENVRDDIIIAASEGEFVIPANVVKFYGIEKFQKMISQAEEAMEQSLAEQEAPTGYAEGGLVTRDPSQLKTGVKAFKTKDGRFIIVPFINGQPIFDIPQDAEETSVADATSSIANEATSSFNDQINKGQQQTSPEGTAQRASQARQQTPQQNEMTPERAEARGSSVADQPSFDLRDISPEDAAKMATGMKGFREAIGSVPGKVALGAIPGVGTAIGVGSAFANHGLAAKGVLGQEPSLGQILGSMIGYGEDYTETLSRNTGLNTISDNTPDLSFGGPNEAGFSDVSGGISGGVRGGGMVGEVGNVSGFSDTKSSDVGMGSGFSDSVGGIAGGGFTDSGGRASSSAGGGRGSGGSAGESNSGGSDNDGESEGGGFGGQSGRDR